MKEGPSVGEETVVIFFGGEKVVEVEVVEVVVRVLVEVVVRVELKEVVVV